MEVKRERYPYCVVLDFMIDYFKNEWRWDVDIKDTFDIYTKTIISPGSKSTLGSTTKKLEFGDDKKLRDQPKGPSADRPCPVSWPFCRNISAVSGTAQAFLFLFRFISTLFAFKNCDLGRMSKVSQK